MTGRGSHGAEGFGLRWRADLPLGQFDQLPCPPDDADVVVGEVETLVERHPLVRTHRGFVHGEGFRFVWRDEAVFDMVGDHRLDYQSGPGWRDALPASFYGSVASIVLAQRGAIPFHASAIELDGRAILIAGPSGAGKSSLVAGLLLAGATFVADDLAIIRAGKDAPFEVVRGRPSMRLHPETARTIDAISRTLVADDPRGKWSVRPRCRTAASALPLAGIIALTADGAPVAAAGRAALLLASLFRPGWFAALPNHLSRQRAVLDIAGVVPLATLVAVGRFDPAEASLRVRRVLQLAEGWLG